MRQELRDSTRSVFEVDLGYVRDREVDLELRRRTGLRLVQVECTGGCEVSNNDGAVSARPPLPYNVCEIATEVSNWTCSGSEGAMIEAIITRGGSRS